MFVDSMLSILGGPHAHLMAPPAGFHASGVFGVTLSGGTFLMIETLLLVFLELQPKLTSQFAARKTCHSVSGLLFLTLDSRTAAARGAMFLIGGSSILMTWELTEKIGIKPFRFGSTRDIGITVYLTLVMLWFFGELPAAALSPMFFADPAGAVVGQWLSRNYPKYNKRWYDKKTVGGSCAVFVVTFGTLVLFYPPMSLIFLLVLSAGAAVAEAVGGSYDNLFLAVAVIGGYRVLAGSA